MGNGAVLAVTDADGSTMLSVFEAGLPRKAPLGLFRVKVKTGEAPRWGMRVPVRKTVGWPLTKVSGLEDRAV
jgi:hypothetical protein